MNTRGGVVILKGALRCMYSYYCQSVYVHTNSKYFPQSVIGFYSYGKCCERSLRLPGSKE